MTESSRDINVFQRIRLRKILNLRKNTFVQLAGKFHLIEGKSNSLYRNENNKWIVKTLVDGKYQGQIDALYVLEALEDETNRSSYRFESRKNKT